MSIARIKIVSLQGDGATKRHPPPHWKKKLFLITKKGSLSGLSISQYLFVSLSLCLSFSHSLFVSFSFCLSFSLSLFLFVVLSLCLSFSLSLFLSLSLTLSWSLFVSFSFCLSFSLSLFLFASLYLCLSLPLFLFVSLCLSFSLSLCLFVSLALCLSVFISLCISVSLSNSFPRLKYFYTNFNFYILFIRSFMIQIKKDIKEDPVQLNMFMVRGLKGPEIKTKYIYMGYMIDRYPLSRRSAFPKCVLSRSCRVVCPNFGTLEFVCRCSRHIRKNIKEPFEAETISKPNVNALLLTKKNFK